VKTDPPMLGMVLGHALEKRGVRVVQWLQDLFPEIAIAYRIPGAGLRALLNLRNRWMGRADGVVVIGELMKQKVLDENVVNPERLHVITNWANGAQIFSLPRESNPLRGEWGLSTKFVVGYSGNLGRVHEFDTFLNAAELLNRSDENVEFLIIGAGPRLGEVKAAVRSRGLTNVQFRPLQERDSLLHSLCVPDVHLCILKPEFEGLVVPSKLYGILAAGRPCIFVGSCNGEISAVLRQGNCGFGVQVGDPKGLSEAIRCLSNDQSLVSEMGRRSRALFEAQFSFPLAAAKWEALISELHLQPVNRG
jgi:glycosyltransferase involved in cell wall biosynthesis